MGFFNDIGKKTSETTSKIAKETKLKIKNNENKGKVNDLYKQIGEKVYKRYKDQADSTEIEELCKQLDVLLTEIEQINREILTLNNKKLCSNCKEEIEEKAQFCQKCGTKQEEIEEPKENNQDIQNEDN